MEKTLKKIWNIISTVLVIFIVLCAVFLMGSRILGYKCFTVISGSMEPTYSVGDLLYVKEVDPNTIKVGDSITFLLNEHKDIATHRVVRIDAKNQHLYTKGDANKDEDDKPVHFKNVVGVPKFSLPKLGYVSDFVQNPPGTYYTIGLGVVLIIIVFVPGMFSKKKKDEDAEQAEAEMKNEIDTAAKENERLKAEVEKLKSQMAGIKTSDEADTPADKES